MQLPSLGSSENVPGAQLVHAMEFPSLNWPGGQEAQTAAPTPLKEPALHDRQALEAADCANLPSAQRVQPVLAASLNLPVSQSSHTGAPAVFTKRPALHALHRVDPELLECLPTVHAAHCSCAPALLNRPAAQNVQASISAASALGTANKPAGQAAQEPEPSVAANRPPGQTEQAPAFANSPFLQMPQPVPAEVDTLPAAQDAQEHAEKVPGTLT